MNKKEATKAKDQSQWTLEDYLENDPEAYKKLKAENPSRAKFLEANYFGGKGVTASNIEGATFDEIQALIEDRAKWTLEDFLEKDPEVYDRMKTENPERANRLEAEYFGKSK